MPINAPVINEDKQQYDTAPTLAQNEVYNKERTEAQINASQIKENLFKLIDKMNDNPSLLSRASLFWYSMPWWQKLIVGAVLIAPILAIGILAHIAVLITIAIMTAIVYTISYFFT